eukprot:6004165-Karenia_brevis.AAC.1
MPGAGTGSSSSNVARSTPPESTEAPAPKKQRTDDATPLPPPISAPAQSSGNVAFPIMVSLGDPDAINFTQPMDEARRKRAEWLGKMGPYRHKKKG